MSSRITKNYENVAAQYDFFILLYFILLFEGGGGKGGGVKHPCFFYKDLQVATLAYPIMSQFLHIIRRYLGIRIIVIFLLFFLVWHDGPPSGKNTVILPLVILILIIAITVEVVNQITC